MSRETLFNIYFPHHSHVDLPEGDNTTLLAQNIYDAYYDISSANAYYREIIWTILMAQNVDQETFNIALSQVIVIWDFDLGRREVIQERKDLVLAFQLLRATNGVIHYLNTVMTWGPYYAAFEPQSLEDLSNAIDEEKDYSLRLVILPLFWEKEAIPAYVMGNSVDQYFQAIGDIDKKYSQVIWQFYFDEETDGVVNYYSAVLYWLETVDAKFLIERLG